MNSTLAKRLLPAAQSLANGKQTNGVYHNNGYRAINVKVEDETFTLVERPAYQELKPSGTSRMDTANAKPWICEVRDHSDETVVLGYFDLQSGQFHEEQPESKPIDIADIEKSAGAAAGR